MFYNLKWRLFPVLLLLITVIPLTRAAATRLQLTFYDQPLELSLPEGFRYPHELRTGEMELRGLYRAFERRPYQQLLADLQWQAAEWQLNDWLFAQLIRQSMQAVYPTPEQAAVVEYSTYFLLAKCGFDVRLTYRDKLLQVNVFTEDVLYEISLIQDGNRQYANISNGIRTTSNSGRSMYLLGQVPVPDGKAFSFVMQRWPKLNSSIATRTVVFQHRGRSRELTLSYDAGLAALLQYYPLVDEQWYMDAPLSTALKNSLIPQLQRMITGKSEREALELLVAFTRSAFVYKDDKSVFGTNKPMVADEVFHYPFSDCEDRSALFYSLVKVLLDLPMIVIAYEDHLSIAVAVPDEKGDAVNYQGKRYLFCDPTGPKQSSQIGVIPQGYEQQSFEIIGHYPGNRD